MQMKAEMKDKLISLNALKLEVEHNFDMQNLYLPVHILSIAEDIEECIVRCKNCEHSKDNNYPCERHTIGSNAANDENWFCADGVIKND